jgi:hypothetical protein
MLQPRATVSLFDNDAQARYQHLITPSLSPLPFPESPSTVTFDDWYCPELSRLQGAPLFPLLNDK